MPFETDEQNTGDMGGMSNVTPAEEPALITVPAFQIDGQAGRTGTTRLQGPFSTSIGAAEDNTPQGQIINYYFPIEVEVIGTLNESHMQQVAEYVYDELITALQS
jgi:hypothetical protein